MDQVLVWPSGLVSLAVCIGLRVLMLASHIKLVILPMHEIGYSHVRLAIGIPSLILKNLLSSADLRGLGLFVNNEQPHHDFITIHVVSYYVLSAVMCL